MAREGKAQAERNQAEGGTEDLSHVIEQSMERLPDEQVKTVRVFGDNYRCNWWVREKTSDWLSFTTGVIRKSRFLRATQTAGKLLIEDLSDRR